MQPYESITVNTDDESLETRGLAELLAVSTDYTLVRPSLLAALGVTEEDLREWESHSNAPPRVEAIASPDDEDGDFEIAPGGEFILDDPDEDDEEDEGEEDEDADPAEDENEDGDEDEEEEDEDDFDEDAEDSGDVDESDVDDEDFDGDVGFEPDDLIIEDDDGEAD